MVLFCRVAASHFLEDLKLLIHWVSKVNCVIRFTELFILITSAPTDMSSLLAFLFLVYYVGCCGSASER